MTHEKAWEELMGCINEIKMDADEDDYSFKIALLCIEHITAQLNESEVVKATA